MLSLYSLTKTRTKIEFRSVGDFCLLSVNNDVTLNAFRSYSWTT